jgi:predicted naringenin-chalcone synthase
MVRPLVLSEFRSVNPAHTIAQTESLAWIASAHARAEATLACAEGRSFDETTFRDQFARRLARFGCSSETIASRGHELDDCGHTRWAEMGVYRLDEHPEGEGMLARTRIFDDRARGVVARLYAEEDTAPADLVHVTCTGYVSPSAAQRLVADKGWGDRTRVTHAYHMGCYAAFPALRIAGGFALADDAPRSARSRRADVVHTELCSLHMNPRLHEPEQLVVQSLFADGFIRYAVSEASAYDGRSPALTLLAQGESIVPDSTGSMSWICSTWGMQMTLARDVPDRLAKSVSAFVDRLCEQAGLDEAARGKALFAVHPGGPRILDRVRDALALREAQIEGSRRVLHARGNMSSATVPHIWMEIARSPAVEEGRAVVSLAFGPGLTLCGAVMRKGAP